ncbi:hypothetical protein ACS0TY_003446 [Phlomoides rotata]
MAAVCVDGGYAIEHTTARTIVPLITLRHCYSRNEDAKYDLCWCNFVILLLVGWGVGGGVYSLFLAYGLSNYEQSITLPCSVLCILTFDLLA